MDLSFNGAKGALLGGVATSALYMASFITRFWIEKDDVQGTWTVGLWETCLDARNPTFRICGEMDFGTSGPLWPSMKLVLSLAWFSVIASVLFNIMEIKSGSRRYEQKTALFWIFSGVLVGVGAIMFSTAPSLINNASWSFIACAVSAICYVIVGAGFITSSCVRNRAEFQIIMGLEVAQIRDARY